MIAGSSRPFDGMPHPTSSSWRRGATLLALFSAVVAFLHVLLLGETAFVRLLWGLSMSAAIAAHLGRPRLERPAMVPTIILCLILAAAAWLRFYRLTVVPDDYHGDIASHGFDARAFIEGKTAAIFTTMFSGIPAFEYWQLALSMRMFGDNLYGIAVHTGIHGMLSILGVYLMTREMVNRPTALIAAALLTISYTHIHFSRLFTTATPLSIMTWTCFFVARGIRTSSPLSFVLGGICLGLAGQVYYPARMMLLILAALVTSFALWDRQGWQQLKGGLRWLALGCFASFGPFLAYALQHPTVIIGRARDVLIFNSNVLAHLKGKYQVSSFSAVVWENTKRSFLTFTSYGDSSTHFGLAAPIVDPMTTLFLVLGLVVVAAKVRERWSAVLLVWLGGTLVLGSVISNDPPFWPHLVVLLVPVAVIAAIGAGEALVAIRRRSHVGYVAAAGAVALAITLMGIRNWDLYYEHVQGNAEPAARIGRIIEATDPAVPIVLIPHPRSIVEREIAFQAARRTVIEQSAEAVRSDVRHSGRRLYIVTANHASVVDALRARYATAVVTPHAAAHGNYVTSVAVSEPGDAGR